MEVCKNFILFFLVSCYYYVISSYGYRTRNESCDDFQVVRQWQFLNYTWPNSSVYNYFLENSLYVPENNAPTGIKIYDGKIFISIPRYRSGIPVTLAYVPLGDAGVVNNELLNPYPNWESNRNDNDCIGLQSVQSMEIDREGRMWVIDGVRINEETKCPAKLVILDIKQHGNEVLRYVFPEEIASSANGILNDIVLDDSDGVFAYLSYTSAVDPGIIVYSFAKNKSWKLKDRSMFPQPEAAGFIVGGVPLNELFSIDGIALSPTNTGGNRTVFYCALTSLDLYSISTDILKDEALSKTMEYHQNITLIGKKEAQSDGLMMDNEGNLFYTLLPLNGVGRWNINISLFTSRIICDNDTEMIWPDTFAMDNMGYLYVISNSMHQMFDASNQAAVTTDNKFKIFKHFTGTKSYIY